MTRLLRFFRGLLKAVGRRLAPASGTPAGRARRTVTSTAAPAVARWRPDLTSLAAAFAAATFGVLGWLVGGSRLTGPDLAVSTGLQSVEHALLLAGMGLVSIFGTWPWNLLSVLAAMAAFQAAGYPRDSLFAGGAALGALGLASGLKAIWARPRPGESLVRVVGAPVGPSFPSGHTLFYVGLFGFLFYWCSTFLRRGRTRTVLLWTFGLLLFLVGPSRVYLGHHWATDVLAGYAIGLVYLLGVIAVHRRLAVSLA
jgi:undecaprenyl-diphosphatase